MVSARAVVFLLGPTASGKTELAAALFDAADAWDAELISVDAAQVYRGMDIGTAKPSRDFLRRYPHHLIDIREPDQPYSAAEFRDDALRLIGDIHARGKLPVLVGGTMFYFAALENGLSQLPSADRQTRAQLDREIAAHGLSAMHEELQRIDPQLAASIRPTDRQRIQRALEIHRITGRAPSEVMAESAAEPLPLPLVKLGLFTAERSELHRRIAARFDLMLANGLVDEVKTIAAQLTEPEAQPAMRIVGYRQVYDYLRNKLSYDDMQSRAIAATRQLAKRQLTWMRHNPNLVWIDATDPKAAAEHAREYLLSRLETMGGEG